MQTPKAGIRSVETVQTDRPVRRVRNEGESPIGNCLEANEALFSQVGSLPLSQWPAGFLVDYVRAGVAQLEHAYEEQAVSKAQEVLGLSLAGPTPHNIVGAYGSTGASFAVSVSVGALPAPKPSGVRIEMDLPAEATESDIPALLDALQASPQDRLVLDPVHQLGADDIRAIVVQLEKAIGCATEGQRTDVFLATAAFLMSWGKMEAMNAGTGEITLSGLDKAFAREIGGEAVSLSMACQSMQVRNEPPKEESADVSRRVRLGLRHN